ncbi:hypothetical protein EK21DRAFT_99003 [Setomelanomma holmii]|uniref:Fungal N-terminal domain-containing protein n=1 Tax=Setomelanomma holmii TaxID=210430 RepID=A0A9P4HEV0_9PLEO|nr:hypothetical protein EK21DRAFT_99003 [Setomelanomma holmii]
MDGLSAVANSLAVVSVAIQLSKICVKLYMFWESIEDAPQEIAAIKEDLQYLISVFKRIEGMEARNSLSLSHTLSNSLTTYKTRLAVSNSTPIQLPAQLQQYTPSSSPAGQYFLQQVVTAPHDVARNTLKRFERVVPDQAQADWSIKELTLHAISQTAMAKFESTSLELFTQDGYMMDESGQVRSKTFVCSEKLKYQVHHEASSFQTALGCLWICKTTIKWLQLLGITRGLEAIAASNEKNWLYNCRLNATHAIPEDSPIFTLCLAGETRARAPLKSALVCEGLTETVLADEKVDMMRLFCDCIDLSDADSDGWLLLHLSANEKYVDFSARNIWLAQQHAVRTVLTHARFSRILERILDLSTEEWKSTSQRHIDALGVWLALRATGRVLLPMVVNAGSFLHMRGFDWVDDGMTHIQFLQALPKIYAAWCHAVLDSVERVEESMREELNQFLGQFGITGEVLLTAISRVNVTSASSIEGRDGGFRCTDDGDGYTALNIGLVAPSCIGLTECDMTDHEFDCSCQAIESDSSHKTHQYLPTHTGSYHEGDVNEDDVVKEEFFDAEPYLFRSSDASHSDVFSSIATLLYRAYGRVWLRNYTLRERLCAACFLLREQYIGEDGLDADFPPMLKSFEGLRAK